MRCPMCEETVLTASHRHGIEVDVCPRCKGIWLDRGELEKILDALDAQLDEAGAGRPVAGASPLPPPPPPRDGDDRYDPRHEPRRDDRYDERPDPRYDDRRDDRRRDRYDDRYDERPWLSPEVLHGRAWSSKSPPPGWKKGKGSKKHKSALAYLLDEVL